MTASFLICSKTSFTVIQHSILLCSSLFTQKSKPTKYTVWREKTLIVINLQHVPAHLGNYQVAFNSTINKCLLRFNNAYNKLQRFLTVKHKRM